MERLLYNCEEISLSYPGDIEYVYEKYNSPTDSNTYIKIINVDYKRVPGSLLHVFINGNDMGLFMIDNVNTNDHLVSITYGEQFYKPLYNAYDDLIIDIGKIGTTEE